MPVGKLIFRGGLVPAAVLVGALTVLTTAPALAQAPGLPRTYNLQRIESPSPVVAGGFGYPLVNVGDTNGDGEDDFGTVQLNLAGTPAPIPDGRLFIISGETGALLNQAPAPDPGNTGNVTGNDRATVDEFIDTLSDIGSCPGGTAGQTCTTNPIGGPDGRREILYGAQGVDVGPVADVGRAYVLDGATLAVLKRLDMPPGDRAQLAALSPASKGGFGRTVMSPRGMPPCAANAGVGACPSFIQVPAPVRIGDMDPVMEVQRVTVDATSGNFTLTFSGQTTANIPFNATAATVNAALAALSNVGTGNVVTTGPAGGPWDVTFQGVFAGTNVAQLTATDVSLAGGGDSVGVTTITQGALGQPDIVVGANLFAETSATAHTDSHCAKAVPAAVRCRDSGRAYVYRGEEIANSNPNVIYDGTGTGQTPVRTLKNPVSQDDAGREFGTQIENFGHVQFPIGDVGSCTSAAIQPGFPCPRANNTSSPDGRPDVVISAHRADVPVETPNGTDFDVGVSFLVDGGTGTILYRFEHPEPQPGSIFGFTLHQTFAMGDLAGTPAPDVVIPAMRQNVGNRTGAGRDYVMNGDFRNASPNNYNLTQLNDPTPTTGGNFGAPTEGVGDVVAGDGFERNEVLIGGFGANAANQTDITDVHFANAFNESILQTIPDPDQQGGSKFGVAVAPLGDLNEDGFLDFAVGADTWDAPGTGGSSGTLNQGRAYIYRSDNSPLPAGPGARMPTPATPSPNTPAVTRAGRAITLGADKSRVSGRGRVALRGRITSAADPANCANRRRVSLQRRAGRRGRYRTFSTARTNRRGRFSKRIRPTRTFSYRVRVPRTARCLAAVSRARRVRVAGR